jgi:hypothetical protein
MCELGCEEFYSTIQWCNTHKAPESFYWGHYDNEFQLEEEYGVRSIRNIIHTPMWASGVNPDNCKYPSVAYPPRTLEYYGRFCSALARRYPGREWILWGEADNTWPREAAKLIQWAGDADTYVEMVKHAYIEMKKVDETCRIGLTSLVGGTLNGEFPTVVENGERVNKLGFFDRVLELGMGDYCDFIPIDLYCYGYGGARNFIIGLRKIKEIMAAHRIKKPIYVVECGAKITPPNGKIQTIFHHEVVTQETQAGFLLQAHRWATQNKVEKFFWHTLKDSSWGLVNRHGKRHISYYAFKMLQQGIEYGQD